VEKTWKPPVAGILNIISGVFGLIGGVFLVGVGIIIGNAMPDITFISFFVLAALLIVLGVLAIVGGVYALQRKMWWLELAGAISTTLFSPIMGIAAIIFTVLSKSEFE